ncbi:hypothetical protein [Mesorhizobium sp.]|uniref:hypothetical protein n=1 Tax=Mesorhizobium sp. TaxID=1871066 RepID=UPI000FE8BA74|nr:hypothetical protein [Mesorhizobium sp.]RWO78793.1 MAG: hypothetical protein EOQ95_30555 [Mesorhizobium sp.]RWQ46462.1 MAG: hypothetical protein EOS84_30405 [Mesorhizobium sp.]TIL65744.1 MAG: hypothetical protein E5Y77_20035 [Mesorhizobium sp.]TIM04320.1 MAG: hypothetical protein E5Y62_32280 [Mesorhizobium sp.]
MASCVIFQDLTLQILTLGHNSAPRWDRTAGDHLSAGTIHIAFYLCRGARLLATRRISHRTA